MNWYKKIVDYSDYLNQKQENVKEAARGLYNQPQGDEDRRTQERLEEHYQENKLIEGEHVTALHALFRVGNWTGFNSYIKKLEEEGFKKSRIDAIVSGATRGKIPQTKI